MEWEERRFLVYMAASAYHVISKELENRVFRHNRIFRHKCMYKQTILTKKWNDKILLKYYIVISNTLKDSWMCFFLLLVVILSELHENPRRRKKDKMPPLPPPPRVYGPLYLIELLLRQVFPEPCQTFKCEIFAKIVNSI